MASKSVTLRIPDELLQAIDDCGEGNRSEAILSLVRMGLEQLGKPVSQQDKPARQVSKTVDPDDVLQTVLQAVRQELSSMIETQVQESLGKPEA